MAIIKPQVLTEDSHTGLLNFLNTTLEISKEEIICWICLWKLRERANVYLARHSCVFKALEEISSKTNLPVLKPAEALKIYEEAQSFGAKIITPRSSEYPQQLKKIIDFPMVLYGFGNCALLQNQIFAIVGSRSASTDALQIAYNFAEDLSKKNVTIVSGFANGVDTAACNGALKFGTIQVLGSGFACLYPKNNAELFQKVVQNGGLFLSEFPINTPAMPDHFPTRNRIITGLSSGVLIGQVNRKGGVSGTLVTLRIAISQGKEVFAYPGNILDERSKICNNLIKNGTAHFTTCVEDILEIISENANKKIEKRNIQTDLQADFFSSEPSHKVSKKLKNFELAASEKSDSEQIAFEDEGLEAVYNALSTVPCSVSDVIVATGFEASKVQELLSELELEGKAIMNHIGKYSIALLPK